jgi:hypothetical protein
MAKVTIKFQETTPQQRRKMFRDLAKRVDVNESLEEFYARFMAGKMGDSRDFIKWAGEFMIYQRLVQRYFRRQSKAA